MSGTILITGGLGYVGGRIAKYLSDNTDCKLRITTRRNIASRPDWLSNGEIIKVDLMSDKDLESACAGVNCIVHLAALNEIDSGKDPELALIVNGLGSLKLLVAAERAGVERFIYLSTAHVYGAPLVGKITEGTLPRPVHPYAITHKVAEDFVLSEHDQKRILGIVVRLSNGVGVPVEPAIERWTLVANDLCRQASTTGRLVLKSSGVQKRDFIALSDVCRAVVHFMNISVAQCGNGIFNLGGENSLSILDMAQQIAVRCQAVFGFMPPISRPGVQGQQFFEHLDFTIKKLKSTGFILNGNLSKEIDDTLRFCKEYFSV